MSLALSAPLASPPAHVACVEQLEAALDAVSGVDPSELSLSEKRDVAVRLNRVSHRLRALLIGIVHASGDVASAVGARSPADWFAAETLSDRGPVARDARLGDALAERYPALRDGVATGQVSIEQSQAIASALDELPPEVGHEVVAAAEAHLIDLADELTPRQLRVFGPRVLETVAPSEAAAHEERLRADEDRRAAENTQLVMWPHGDGTTEIRARVPDAIAARLSTYLHAYTAPRRAHLEDGLTWQDPASGERVPYPRLLGQAFCSLLEDLPTERLPRHAGTATSVHLVVDLPTLESRVGSGELLDCSPVSVDQVLRLACNASLVPSVMDSEGRPLHLGRATRLFSAAQRTALAVRDRRCRASGCTMPADFCEAHHVTPWQHGGRTDLDNAILLCAWHHHRAHDRDYDMKHLPNGEVRYTRRT